MKILILLLSLFIGSQAYASYVDSETLANDNARKSLITKLKKENKYGCNLSSYNCSSKYAADALEIYPLRGNAYAKSKYINFTKEQAFSRLIELAALYQKAENISSLKKGNGIVRKDKIEEEGWFLFSNVLNFDKKSPVWRDFYSKKGEKKAGYLPSPFIDINCNMLIKNERDLQVSIRKKCPENL